jgi:hypothetical protein
LSRLEDGGQRASAILKPGICHNEFYDPLLEALAADHGTKPVADFNPVVLLE